MVLSGFAYFTGKFKFFEASSSFRWARLELPVVVELGDDLIEAIEAIEAIEDAVGFWNEQVGCILFQVSTGISKGLHTRIEVMASHKGANSLFLCSRPPDQLGRPASIFVNIDGVEQLDEYEQLVGEARRVLGYLLGLEYDSFTNSVMYDKELSPHAELTQKDKVLLESLYG